MQTVCCCKVVESVPRSYVIRAYVYASISFVGDFSKEYRVLQATLSGNHVVNSLVAYVPDFGADYFFDARD